MFTNLNTGSSIQTLERILAHYEPYLIIAPPRSCSTALARALVHNSHIGSYVHEPCDQYAQQRASIETIILNISKCDLTRSILIKEMTFQLGMGNICECFLQNVRKPIVFLTRNPRLTIESRMKMVLNNIVKELTPSEKHSESITYAMQNRNYSDLDDIVTEKVFPLAYTGWNTFARQLNYCHKENIDYIILDADIFRSMPRKSLVTICMRWGLDFEEEMLVWSPKKKMQLGKLSEQSSWYNRVMKSTSVELPTEVMIAIEHFPKRFIEHLHFALQIYESTLNDPNNLLPSI